jgi:hypothetical protein
MTLPVPAKIRHRVDPRDVPAKLAARRLYLTLEQFNQMLPELIVRGFPGPDPTTGMFDLKAIDAWLDARHSPGTRHTSGEAPQDARKVVASRLARL